MDDPTLRRSVLERSNVGMGMLVLNRSGLDLRCVNELYRIQFGNVNNRNNRLIGSFNILIINIYIIILYIALNSSNKSKPIDRNDNGIDNKNSLITSPEMSSREAPEGPGGELAEALRGAHGHGARAVLCGPRPERAAVGGGLRPKTGRATGFCHRAALEQPGGVLSDQSSMRKLAVFGSLRGTSRDFPRDS